LSEPAWCPHAPASVHRGLAERKPCGRWIIRLWHSRAEDDGGPRETPAARNNAGLHV